MFERCTLGKGGSSNLNISGKSLSSTSNLLARSLTIMSVPCVTEVMPFSMATARVYLAPPSWTSRFRCSSPTAAMAAKGAAWLSPWVERHELGLMFLFLGDSTSLLFNHSLALGSSGGRNRVERYRTRSQNYLWAATDQL